MKMFAFYFKNGLFTHNSIKVSKHMSFEIHPKHPFQENHYCISLRSIFLAHLEASSARVGGLPFIKVPVRFRIGESEWEAADPWQTLITGPWGTLGTFA